MSQQPRYRQIDHTADVALEVRGETMVDLYRNAAEGVCSLLYDLPAVQPEEKRAVSAEGHDREELLVDWLSELLYLAEAEEFLTCRFAIKDLSETALHAQISGECFDPQRHRWNKGIKAVTYHDLEIEATPEGGWTVTIILDT